MRKRNDFTLKVLRLRRLVDFLDNPTGWLLVKDALNFCVVIKGHVLALFINLRTTQ